MNIQKIMLALSLLTSLTCTAAPQSTVPTTPAPQPTIAPQNQKPNPVAKPNMADYCKEHTC